MDYFKLGLVVLLLLGLGIVMIMKPDLLWKLEHIFTVKNGEPTELYLGLMRVFGVCFILGAIFFLYASFH